MNPNIGLKCKIVITAVRGLFCKDVAVKMGPWALGHHLTGHKESVAFILPQRLLQLVFQTPIFKIGNWGTLLLRLSASFWRASF